MENRIDIEILERYYNEGLLIKRNHPSLPLTIWNYSQHTQYYSKWDDITLRCRGLVTHSQTGEILARPFCKFFNIEEGKHVATEHFEVYEKLDGSLIILFWYIDQWVVASRGSFNSDQSNAAQRFFNEKLENIFETDTTYMFEFTSEWNKIVVDYQGENLTLIGAIKTHTGEELSWEKLKITANAAKCNIAKKYDGLLDVSLLKDLINKNEEGFVVKFSNGNRVKVKGEEYIRLHRIMTNLSSYDVWKNLMIGRRIALENIPDEFFEWIKSTEENIINDFNRIKNLHIEEYKKYAYIESAKEFARVVYGDKNLNAKILFNLRNNKEIDSIIWKMVKPEYKLPCRY